MHNNIKMWIPPANGNKYRNAAEKHSDIAKEYEKQYDTLYWKVYDRLTEEHMIGNIENVTGKVLDAGGGTGKWARMFARRGYEVTVLDLSQEMLEQGVEYAKQEGLENKIKFIRGDICELPFPNNEFDIVISQGNPVCYSEDPYKAIYELNRVAKNGADIVISVHNKLSMIHYFYYFMGKVSYDDIEKFCETNRIYIDYPIYAFTPNELRTVCEDLGLHIKSLVGKQLISGYVQSESYLKILSDDILFEKTIDLEKKYWNTEEAIGMASHLEIVCRKMR